MHAMVGVWLLFSLILFIAEPVLLRRWFLARAKAAPNSTFRLIQWLHWALLIVTFSQFSVRWPAATAFCFLAELMVRFNPRHPSLTA